MEKWTIENIKLGKNNRKINEKHVMKLAESMKSHGYIKELPILVNKDGEIIDGQHRYAACVHAHIKPVILEMKTEKDDLIPVINSMQKTWKLADYVNYYASKGYPDYIILKGLCSTKNISIAAGFAIFSDKSSHNYGITSTQHPLKLGTFKVADKSEKGLKKIDKKADMILDLIVELGLPKTERLITAIIRLMQRPEFIMDKMRQKIQYQRRRIYRCTTIAEYMQMLADVYNYKNTGKKVVI